MPLSDEIRRRIGAAHQEALRVGDSPLRADQLAARIAELSAAVAADAGASDETRARVRAALANAERVLRRDDDGREAARHLQSAERLTEERAPKEWPF
jgi:hypothetical protein